MSFKIGSLIWGKIQGYPWWPGIVKIFYNKKINS